MSKTFVIEVFKAGQPGTDTEHIVQVKVIEGDVEIGRAQLPGGDYENAVNMAQGLHEAAKAGVDLTAMLPGREADK